MGPKSRPEEARMHDFMIAANGVYDMAVNEGWAGVRLDRDTAASDELLYKPSSFRFFLGSAAAMTACARLT